MRLILAALIVSWAVPAFGIDHTPVESGAVLSQQLTAKQVDALAAMVRAFGYRCDSVSGARPWAFSYGFTIHCNQFRYEYEVRDKGGQWEVTVK